MKYNEYGSRNLLIFECLCCFEAVDHLDDFDSLGLNNPPMPKFFPVFLFLQKKRTKNYFNAFFAVMVAFDMQEPYLWEADPVVTESEALDMRRTPLWWLRNPLGKYVFMIAVPSVSQVIAGSYRIRSYYEMTRILAEFQRNYSVDKTHAENAAAVLTELESYKKFYDPCSGKPYAWNIEKKVIYSIATDRTDNGGVDGRSKMSGTDFAVRVVLKNTHRAVPPSDAARK